MAVPFANITPVTGLVANLSVGLAWDNLCPTLGVMPEAVRLRWAGFDGDLCDTELEIEDDGMLVLTAFGRTPSGPPGLSERFGLLNNPAEIVLKDGSKLTAPFADIVRQGAVPRRDGTSYAGCRFELPVWSWLPGIELPWALVGCVRNIGEPFGDNLVVEAGSRAWNRGHLRLVGRHAWHLVKGGAAVYAVASACDEPPTIDSVAQDLMAMEFVAGQELDLPVLWAVDANGCAIGGMSLGKRRPAKHNRRCPTPTGRTPDGPTGCWVAPLFRCLVPQLHDDDSLVSTAIAGYMDGLRGHVHAEYLLGQVALEAFCSAVAPSGTKSHLVASVGDWQAWVAGHADEIGRFATDDGAKGTLLNRLKHNVFTLPATKTVQRAFLNWAIDLPESLLREVGRRNDVAHRFLMLDERSGDFQEAADRICMIQTLLAAAIAKHVGYRGPIVGWERGLGGHLKVPDFWAWSDLTEAHERFSCSRAP